MDKTAEDLKVRTKRFCIAILDFVDTLPRTPSGDASRVNSLGPDLACRQLSRRLPRSLTH